VFNASMISWCWEPNRKSTRVLNV